MSINAASPNKPRGLESKWKVLISVMFGVFMIILDSTVVNIAFPTLRLQFGASLADAQWVLSIYVLALGVTTPVSGFLADRFGIKRMYLLGLALFTLGSVLCGLAPSLGMLIVARALQGFGGGIAQPLGPAQLFRAFPPKEQGTALGLFGIALVVAPALGPILGGWLVDLGIWRAIFFINVPIGILGVFLGSRFLLDYRVEKRPSFDPYGLITAVAGFGAVLYAASEAEIYGWTGSTTLLIFGFGLLMLAVPAGIGLKLARGPMLALRGLAIGLTLQTSFVTALGAIPLNQLPRGSSLLNSTRFVVQAVSVAALATILVSNLSADVKAQQQKMQDSQTMTAAAFGVCETPGVAPQDNLPPGISPPTPDVMKAKIISGLQEDSDESMGAFEAAYRITFFASIGALLLGALLPGWPGKWSGRGG